MRVTSIMKVAGWDCDMRCSYCYYDCPRFENQGKIMPFSVFDKTCALQVASADSKTVSMIWHGGEPTLPGPEYYEEVLTIQQRHQKLSGVKIDNKIQTNGLDLTNEWVEFFLEKDFKVGLSIDGPADIHDAYRVDTSGKGTHSRIMQNVARAHNAGLDFGSIAVLTDKSVGRAKDVFKFFVEAEIKSIKVKPCYEKDEKTGDLLPFSISPREYGEFLIELFNAWVEYDDPSVTVVPLDDVLRGLMGRETMQCVFKRDCAQFWSVWPDGSVYQCEYHHNEAAYIGNILKDTQKVLHANHVRSPIMQSIKEPNTGCLNCKWNDFCKGGCSRYDVGLGLERNLYCTSLKMLFSHVAKYLEKSL